MMTEATDDLAAGTIDVHMSVNEVIDRFPCTVGAFNAHGIDSCGRGSVSLAVAAPGPEWEGRRCSNV